MKKSTILLIILVCVLFAGSAWGGDKEIEDRICPSGYWIPFAGKQEVCPHCGSTNVIEIGYSNKFCLPEGLWECQEKCFGKGFNYKFIGRNIHYKCVESLYKIEKPKPKCHWEYKKIVVGKPIPDGWEPFGATNGGHIWLRRKVCK